MEPRSSTRIAGRKSRRAAELAAYLKAQDDRTRGILASIPGRKPLLARLTSLVETVTSTSGVVRKNGVFFFERITPDSSLAKLYVEEPGKAARVVLDPATLGSGGHHFAMSYFVPSDDGKRVAVGLVPDGDEPGTVTRIVDVLRQARRHVASRRIRRDLVARGRKSDLLPALQDLPAGAPVTALYRTSGPTSTSSAANRAATSSYSGPGNAGYYVGSRRFRLCRHRSGFPVAVDIAKSGVRNELRVYVAPKAGVRNGCERWTPVCGYDDGVTNLTLHGDTIYS